MKPKIIFKFESLPLFIKYNCDKLITQKNKDKQKKLEIEQQQKYKEDVNDLKELKEKTIAATLLKKCLTNEKKFIKKSYLESQLECELNELKMKNKLEEVKKKE